jgi:tetratricopeptide (TPR) repeat protein
VHCGARFDGSTDGGAGSSVNNPVNKSLKLPMRNNLKGGDDPGSNNRNPKGLTRNTSAGGNSGITDEIADANGQQSAETINQESSMSETGSSPRSKWLEDQEKIKTELEALKGKVSKDFKLESDFSMNEKDEIFTFDDNKFEEVKEASTGLETLSRPLTPEEEQKKNELMSEINDLKEEGFDVSRLERIVSIDPTSAWQEFVKFMDDIDTLQKLRKRYSELDTTGFENLSQSIRNKMDNPDLVIQIERELDEIETKIAQGHPVEDQGGLKELIDAGKDAFKNMEYQKALNFYTSALKIDPNNREVQFYKKKTEAKLTALSSMKGAPEVEVEATDPASYQPAAVAPPALAPQPTVRPSKPRTPMKPPMRRVVKPGVRPAAAPPPRKKATKTAPKVALKPKAAPPKASIPTGANVEVKTPLSVSMTPKLPSEQRGPPKPRTKVPTPTMKPKPALFKSPKPAAAPPAPKAQAAAPEPEVASDNPAEIEALGFNAFINKDYQQALHHYEQVLAIDPNFPGAAGQRDKCLEALGLSGSSAPVPTPSPSVEVPRVVPKPSIKKKTA